MTNYMKEAERLLSEYGDAVSDAVVFAQDPDGYSMRMEEATRAALLAHIQRGAVPDGWQLVPKEPTPEMLAGGWGYWLNVMEPGKQRDTAAKEYTAMLAAAPSPEHFRDAAKMMAEPAEVPMPEPIGFIDSNDEETWATLTQNAHELATLKLRSTVFHVSQMRTYGAACRAAGEAAGYARGLAEAGRDAERYRWLTQHAYIGECFTHDGVVFEVHNTDRQVPIDGDVDAAIDAALRGEVKP